MSTVSAPSKSKTVRTVGVVTLILLGMGCRRLSAQELTQQEHGHTARYVAGELIVKLKPEAGAALDAALQAGQPPTNTGLARFDALNTRYGVRAIEPLFSHTPGVEEIRRKYPERSRRAPPGVQTPSLRYLYKLTMRHEVNVLQAAQDYAANPELEYAQPNHLATIQPTPRHSP